MSTLPLEDVTILAVEQYGAGPWATLQLADLGARIIKIEDPRFVGDVGRYVPPFAEASDSLFFETLNRNKLSIALDLGCPAGREVFERLVGQADAVFSNLRGDLPEKLKITHADLRRFNETIVCCSLSGFGMTGPRRSRAGYDYMMQGLAGWMSLTGDPGSKPTKTGLSLVDLSAGYVAAIALQAGIIQARRDGVGCDCDLSLFETALSLLCYVATWNATMGYEVHRSANSAHPSIVPFQNFATADGWIVVACAKQKFWERFCSAVGRADWTADERFRTMSSRNQFRDDLLPLIDGVMSSRSTEEWLSVLDNHDVPCAPVNDVAEALADVQTVARGAVVSIQHPRFGEVRQVASPLRFRGQAQRLVRAPFFGEHTEEVLAGMGGYEVDQIRSLRDRGAFGPESPIGAE